VLFEANLIQTQIQNYFMKVTNILLTKTFWSYCSWKDEGRKFDKNNIYGIAFCIYFYHLQVKICYFVVVTEIQFPILKTLSGE